MTIGQSYCMLRQNSYSASRVSVTVTGLLLKGQIFFRNFLAVCGDVAELCSAYLPGDAGKVPVGDPEAYQIGKAECVRAESGIAAQDAEAGAQVTD